MATPLNLFKTIVKEVTTSPQELYIAPVDVTTIILMVQITNITDTVPQVTLWTETPANVVTELLKDFYVPKNDVVSGLVGKLILEEGFSLNISASANNKLKVTVSVLETSNV